jgi:SAM-dependent methyltransferase
MAKQGEIDYLKNLEKEKGFDNSIGHAMNKPFSDPDCSKYLSELAAIMELLPPPPARLLDAGCGSGWTSCFFAKRGYTVVGVDIAGDLIELARGLAQKEGLENAHFEVHDYESMPFKNEFDCAVFYDSLHHSMDEKLAIQAIYSALKTGGRCVTDEPGKGHATSRGSIEAMEKYGVSECDMPPSLIFAAGKAAGFKKFLVYPHPCDYLQLTYRYRGSGFGAKIRKVANKIKLFLRNCKLRSAGITLMVK